MSEIKIKYEHLLEELTIASFGLVKTIENSNVKIRQVFSNLDESLDRGLDDVDLSVDIRRRFEANIPLKGVLLRFYWSNFQTFPQSVMDWCIKTSSFSSLSIERYIIKSWIPTFQDRSIRYGELTPRIGKPQLLTSWDILDDLGKLSEFGNGLIELYRKNSDSIPQFLLKSLFFRYLVADYCYKNLKTESLVELVSSFEQTNLNAIHYEEMSKSQNFDIASKLMIAALLKQFRYGKVENDQIYLWLNSLKSALGDPRSLGHKWQMIEELEPEGYFNWVSSLNEEDIIFFFANLEKVIHPERREFWLRFVRKAKRIAVVLDAVQREKLIKKYQHNDKMLAVINRSYQFNNHVASEQQLIVYFFNDFVFVEGSNTGFACQVYSEIEFKKRFADSFYKTEISSRAHVIKPYNCNSFRGAGSGIVKALQHNPASPAWEQKFLNYFSTIGIFPDTIRESKPEIPKSTYKQVATFAEPIRGADLSAKPNFGIQLNEVLSVFLQELKKFGAEIYDLRPKGKIWVIYDLKLKPIIDEMKRVGITVRLAQKGGKATQYRMAWWLEGE